MNLVIFPIKVMSHSLTVQISVTGEITTREEGRFPEDTSVTLYTCDFHMRLLSSIMVKDPKNPLPLWNNGKV